MANNRKKTPIDSLEDTQIDISNNDTVILENVQPDINISEKDIALAEDIQTNVSNDNIATKKKIPILKKEKYTVECVGKNRVWLRKDTHTVKMLVGSFDYKVGDIIEL